jgi:DNA-binding NtrC family response regulator
MSVPVLLLGDTGVGKEVVARTIHEAGPRRAGRMVCVNCGSIPESLLESVLFGHDRGAFTGADRRRPGLFEAAAGGTLFLDEVGELSASAQAALLRVLETGCITRVGSTEEVAVDVRIVAATHRDLEAMCARGEFRTDLLYRLNTVVLRVPPLRSRTDEIVPLARCFLRRLGAAEGTVPRALSEEAEALLLAHHWPGNIRELRNAVENAAIKAKGPVVSAADLEERIRRGRIPTRQMRMLELHEGPSPSFRDRLTAYERRVLLDALVESGWNKSQAARRLQMPLRTFTHKLRAHNIRRGQ